MDAIERAPRRSTERRRGRRGWSAGWLMLALAVASAVARPDSVAAQASARMVRDVNVGFGSSLLVPPTQPASAGNIAFFAAQDRLGVGLWRTDGTTGGTRRLTDLEERARSVSVGAVIDGIAYVIVELADPQRTTVVWRSDGTPAGTRPVGDERPLAPHLAIEADGATYYLDTSARRPSSGAYALWRSEAGSVEELGGEIGQPLFAPARFGDALFFYAFDPQRGDELWRSDGTRNGTKLFRDLQRGGSGSLAGHGPQFTQLDGRLCFFANASEREQLWCTDGTVSGTAVIAPQPFFSPRGLIRVGPLLYFRSGGLGREELWRSDGSEAGTFSLGSIDSTPIELDGFVYFLRTPPGPPFEAPDGQLWRTDGTPAGTVEVARIRADRTGYRCNDWQPMAFGGRLLFLADSLYSSCEPAAFDPSTTAVTRLYPREPGAFPLEGTGFVELDGRVVFVGTIDTSSELWSTNGTPAGTGILRDGFTNTQSSSPGPFLAVDGGVLFSAHTFTTGAELWFSDGSASGTVRLTDTYLDPPRRPLLAALDGGALMVTFEQPRTLSFIDGNGGPPMPLNARGGDDAASLFSTGERAYFDVGGGLSLTDGRAGTRLISPVRADFAFGAARLGNILLFTNDHDRQLWRTEGSAAGMVPLWTPEGESQSHPNEITAAGDLAFFRARTLAEGEELWVSDATEAGTRLAADIHPNPAGDRSARPRRLTAVDNWVLFDADDGVHGRELWHSNGSVTEMVTDLAPGATSAIELDPSPPAAPPFAHAGLLYFSASVPQPGSLWRSDGTAAGTALLKSAVTASSFTAIEDSVFFLAAGCGDDDRVALWTSDGTPEQTQCAMLLEFPAVFVTDPAPGFAISNGRLYFAADDGWAGAEPWSVSTAALLCRGDEDGDRQVSINELIRGVAAALDSAAPPRSLDADHNGRIAISELITGVRNAIDRCTEPVPQSPDL